MEIQEIKQRLSIETVLNHYHLQSDRHNFIKCPFHGDEDPSLKIYPGTNTFYCFGCGATGDQIEFIQLKEKITKHEAILKAASLTGDILQTNIKTKPMQEVNREDRIKAITAAFTFFARSRAGRDYLAGRGIDVNFNSIIYHYFS